MATEDSRTLWIGNLENKVTEELLFELLLQTGPIQRLVFPTEGEGDDKKHKGHAYIVFQHKESVAYATQILEGTSLFSQQLSLKVRGLPETYKTERSAPAYSPQSSNFNRVNRFSDNNSLRGSFNRGSTFPDYSPRSRGGYQARGTSNYNNYNSRYNNFNNAQIPVVTGTTWQQGNNTSSGNLEEKRQRILAAQNATIGLHQQIQQQAQGVATQQYNQQAQAQQWTNNTYNAWNMAASMGTGDMTTTTTTYQYGSTQYNPWYPTQ